MVTNRNNGLGSTGPRSAGGKNRASRNSFRHGLSVLGHLGKERTQWIERLAREIAADSAHPISLECAYVAAAAEFDLAQVRRVKVAMINRMIVFGELEPMQTFRSVGQAKRFLSKVARGSLTIPNVAKSSSPIPATEPERTTEAIRRVLRDLIKLDRYERRAAARRRRALCERD
jgi:hypothetical protein